MLLVDATGLVDLPVPSLADRFLMIEDWASEAAGTVNRGYGYTGGVHRSAEVWSKRCSTIRACYERPHFRGRGVSVAVASLKQQKIEQLT